MTPILEHLGVFICAALVDALWVMWIHYSERNNAALSALVSMILAGFTLAGMGSAIRDIAFAPAYVAGLGVGSYAAVAWKARRARLTAVRERGALRAVR